MMKRRYLLSIYCVAVAITILIMPCAMADTLVSNDSGSWQGTWTANENNNPFWDHTSWDGSQKNIGYYISGTGAFTTQYLPYNGPGSYLPYLGVETAADKNFYFEKDSNQSIAALKIEIAGDAGYNEFGWYDYDSSGQKVLHVIFDGEAGSSSAYTFTPLSTKYGFYFVGKRSETDVIGTWYTEGNGDHFAVFSATGSEVYWIGMEDLNLCSSDLDYNDMVVKVSSVSVPVPEPTTMLLVGLGLIGLAGIRRRFQ
jgi:hypothetical protein